QALFASPTIAGLALALHKLSVGAAAAARPDVVPLQGDRTRTPASSSQQRLWFLDQFIPNPEVYNLCEFVHLRGALDVQSFRRALELLVARHEALRTTFAEDAGAPVQIVHPAGPVELPILDLTGQPPSLTPDPSPKGGEGSGVRGAAAEAQRLALEASRQLFDLTKGPLWRVQLLRLAPDEHLLLLTLHHIIADGWSM